MSLGEVAMLALRMAISLGLVLTLLVFLARFAARRGVGRSTGLGYDIEVLARRSLSRSASVQIVRVATKDGDQTLLLGVGESGVRVLRRLPAAEEKRDAATQGVADVQDTTGGLGSRSAITGDVVRSDRSGTGGVLRMLDELIRPEGRHRATRGDRRRSPGPTGPTGPTGPVGPTHL